MFLWLTWIFEAAFGRKPAGFAMAGAEFQPLTATEIPPGGWKAWDGAIAELQRLLEKSIGAVAATASRVCTECGQPFPALRRPGSKTCRSSCRAARTSRLTDEAENGVTADVPGQGVGLMAGPHQPTTAAAASPGQG